MQIEQIKTGGQADSQTKCREIRSAVTFGEDWPSGDTEAHPRTPRLRLEAQWVVEEGKSRRRTAERDIENELARGGRR